MLDLMQIAAQKCMQVVYRLNACTVMGSGTYAIMYGFNTRERGRVCGTEGTTAQHNACK